MNTHKLLRERIHQKAGLPLYNINDLQTSEWSPVFEGLMRRRLIMGALRYGLLHEEGKPKYDRVSSMINRLKLYTMDGNIEHLVDVANLALCEFEEGHKNGKQLLAIDEHTHHTK